MARDLYLHEFIDIIGQGQWDYMEHAKGQAGHEKVDFELLGTWYTMGITGPLAAGDQHLGDPRRLGRLVRQSRSPRAEAAHERTPREVVGGGLRLPYRRLRPVARRSRRVAPTWRSSRADDVTGTLFVHEITEVRPGTALEYLDAVREIASADHGRSRPSTRRACERS